MNNLLYVLPYLKKHRVRISIRFLAILGGTGCSILQPYILRLAIDSLQHRPTLSALTTYVLLFLATALAQSILAFVQRSTVNRVSRFLEYDLRNDAFRHLQKLDQRFYQEM